ncbi:hypothetical protein NDU88_009648 [Pleurodeles waltl]|uniref:Uncharacterized protein n=1 Tax=Pleurodeles waltl TaxID=8319 RepID=A0AAV7QS71_PLEWA|nr:hypothetical protein NDU88_009648 [Pleurodeles waltl]
MVSHLAHARSGHQHRFHRGGPLLIRCYLPLSASFKVGQPATGPAARGACTRQLPALGRHSPASTGGQRTPPSQSLSAPLSDCATSRHRHHTLFRLAPAGPLRPVPNRVGHRHQHHQLVHLQLPGRTTRPPVRHRPPQAQGPDCATRLGPPLHRQWPPRDPAPAQASARGAGCL